MNRGFRLCGADPRSGFMGGYPVGGFLILIMLMLLLLLMLLLMLLLLLLLLILGSWPLSSSKRNGPLSLMKTQRQAGSWAE